MSVSLYVMMCSEPTHVFRYICHLVSRICQPEVISYLFSSRHWHIAWSPRYLPSYILYVLLQISITSVYTNINLIPSISCDNQLSV